MLTLSFVRRIQLSGLAIFFLSAPSAAHAQITIEAADLEQYVGRSYDLQWFETRSASGLQAIADADGANQTWDLTAITFENVREGTMSFTDDPSVLPGGDNPAFSESNWVFAAQLDGDTAGEDSTGWFFSEIGADSLFTNGFVFASSQDFDGDGEVDTLDFVYDPPRAEQPLPTAFGDSWTTHTTQRIMMGGISFNADMTVASNVDGYGTLITDQGSAPALRILRRTETRTFITQTTVYSIEFVTKEGIKAAIDLSSDGATAEGASYQVLSMPDTDIEGGELPRTFALEQNYPNPFNPETTIQYEIDAPQHVRLSVYDMLGRRVAVLVNVRQIAGTHTVRFNASSLTSGAYLYRLQADGRSLTRAMTVLE